MRVFVFNTGSSSVKFQLLDVTPMKQGPVLKNPTPLLRGVLKGIGRTATLEMDGEVSPKIHQSKIIRTHQEAAAWIFESLKVLEGNPKMKNVLSSVEAIGHRVVHGGNRFSDPVVIDKKVEERIEALNELAPLHNPPCLAGIQSTKKEFGMDIPMVAVFDTGFHQDLPTVAQTYAIDHELVLRHGIRRYGFHGIAHASLSESFARFSGKPLKETKLITLQLGHGCSITALAGGKSVDTSMGFTPLEGLVMGSRSGDLDPSIVRFLSEKEHVDAREVEQWLNQNSGLLGVSGRSPDMRELLRSAKENHDEQIELAIELFCYRIRKYIGAYLAVLEGAEALVFGGGIGEASSEIRARICQGLAWCGLKFDQNRNLKIVNLTPGSIAPISQDHSPMMAFVAGTDEESWIAKETVRCLT